VPESDEVDFSVIEKNPELAEMLRRMAAVDPEMKKSSSEDSETLRNVFRFSEAYEEYLRTKNHRAGEGKSPISQIL